MTFANYGVMPNYANIWSYCPYYGLVYSPGFPEIQYSEISTKNSEERQFTQRISEERDKNNDKILRKATNLLKKIHKHKNSTHNVKDCWTAEEDKLLLELVNQNKEGWQVISVHLKNRSWLACERRYQRLIQVAKDTENTQASMEKEWQRQRYSKRNPEYYWTKEEDELLMQLVESSSVGWRNISKRLKVRSWSACERRYQRLIKEIRAFTDWSENERQQTKKLIKEFAPKWIQIQKRIPKFSIKQIRSFYENCVKEEEQQEQFTFQDDLQIIKSVVNSGPHFSMISSTAIQKTEEEIRKRYQTCLEMIVKEAQADTLSK